MPRNPSQKQREASRRNLRGHHGPKTEKGKQVVASNGTHNKGVKTAKARAKVLAARHGPNTDTFYSFAGCLTCQKHCMWPSFSSETPYRQLPLSCLEEVVRDRPDRCFYNLEGICCVQLSSASAKEGCILDTAFLYTFPVLDGDSLRREAAELKNRREVVALKKEIALYLDEIRRHGPSSVIWTPQKSS